jgi:class 3 adenylate cyclase
MDVCARCGAELPAGARFCPSCAAPVDPAGSEERKLATVMFADLVGSTALGGSQDPERTRALLDRFYDAMAEEIERAGGTVEKFAGDAVMAVFGAPAALEDHAERALHATLAMRYRTRELDERLELRVGVNTGEVVVGRAREGSSFVTGDPVNVAARLEQGANPGEILVGERTVTAVRGAFEFEEERTIEAKGKPEGVACRRLVRALSLVRTRGVSGLRRAFVGREDELARLLAGYRAAVGERRARVVTVLGDAGVGKTRLVRELWERLSDESEQPLRRTGRCLPYGQGITYSPLAEVLREHLGLLDSDPADVVLERLGDRRLLGLAVGLDVAEGMHPLLVRDRFQDAWAEFLSEAATERPLVVLVEDLHWADDQLLDLLEQLAANVEGPVLMLATARPELIERRPGWGRVGEVVEVEALSAEDSLQLLDELLAGELPGRLRDVVLDRAEGNPFFVEEVLETLIDRGLLRRENGGWTLADLPHDFDVPDSVQAVLSARIDLLEPKDKEALQAAAVMGRVFWAGPVYELVQGDPDLRVLEERDFVRRRSGSSMAGEREYAIKHTLTREVAYASLPKPRRARLHAAFAAWLERLGEDRDDLASLLAHHYAEAVRPEDADLAWAGAEAELLDLRQRALVWLKRAADLATSRYELEDAIDMYRRALALEEDPGKQAALWHALGRALALRYDDRFADAIERAIDLTEDPEAKAEMYADLALDSSARAGMWRTLPPEALIKGWIERALAAPATSPARAKAVIARTFWREGTAEEAVSLAEQLGDVDLHVLALNAQALLASGRGDHKEALVWADRARSLVDRVTDPDIVADAYAIAIPAQSALGRFREAEESAAVQREVNEKLTPHHRVHGVAIQCELAELRGDWQRLLELQPDVVERVEANVETPCVRNPRSLLLCALAHEQTGGAEEASALEARARDFWMEGHGLALDGVLLKLALARRDLVEVERLCDAIPAEWRGSWFYLSGSTALMEALGALHRLDELDAAVARFSWPDTVFEAHALRALGVGREDRGLLEQALARFEELGLDWHAAETRKLVA